MNIIAAILILGATGSAERRLETEQEIAGIVVRVVIGAIGDVFNSKTSGLRPGGLLRMGQAPTLTIDGQHRTGWRALGEAVLRVARYAANGTGEVDGRGHRGTGEVERISGSVGYAYRLRIRGYDVRRATRIENGYVLLTTDAWWTEVVPVGRLTRRVPIHVVIVITATEHADGSTLLVGTATGTADTSDFSCGIVRRIAERKAAATLNSGLAAALASIQRKGTDWYHGADEYTAILDNIGNGVRTIGPRIGRLR